jgi:sec-independent protein translocase protein TatC
MSSPEEQKGAQAPDSGAVPSAPGGGTAAPDDAIQQSKTESAPATDSGPSYDEYPYEDPYYSSSSDPAPVVAPAETALSAPAETALSAPAAAPAAVASGGGATTPPKPPEPEAEPDDEDGMLRMSFLEHLEELRARIIKALMGFGVAFVISLTFTSELWAFVCQPAIVALKSLGFAPSLVQITPMESFNVIWLKLPVLCSIFLASPWVLYQVWAFIAPGLYRKERRWAAPFVICSAGLFILGALFAYFVAFRFGLTFLLSIGRGNYVTPMVSITEYFDLFVNVTLGIAVVFELPVLIFFLSLLRIVTPGFLIRHSRYAILAIFVLAAIITPTPDVFNLMLFATPMVALFYVGVFASYLLVLEREGRKFPWKTTLLIVGVVLLMLAAGIYISITWYGFKLVLHWPFLTR